MARVLYFLEHLNSGDEWVETDLELYGIPVKQDEMYLGGFAFYTLEKANVALEYAKRNYPQFDFHIYEQDGCLDKEREK